MNRVIVLLGPTAVGKTEIAVELAGELNAEIISSDSVQVYRYMDIGTAKPTPEQLSKVRHHLIDIKDPDEPYSSGEFVGLCLKCIDDIESRGKRAIIVGGSGFYVDSLVFGLDDVPKVDERVFLYLEDAIRETSAGDMYKWLEVVDNVWATRINAHDSQRIKRGLGVYLSTGVAIGECIVEKKVRIPVERFSVFVVNEQMDTLRCRIEKRVIKMIEKGLVDEVKELIKMGYATSKPMGSIGYKEAIDFVLGKIDMDELVKRITRDTILYAKRQVTHFRSRFDWAHWVPSQGAVGKIKRLL